VLLVVFAIAWTVSIYRREQSPAGWVSRAVLVALRLTAIAAILVMLAQWAIDVRLTGPPTIALVIDRSASMEIVDRYDDPEIAPRIAAEPKTGGVAEISRLQLLNNLLTRHDSKWLNTLREHYRLDVYLAGSNIERFAAIENGELSQPFAEVFATGGANQNATRLGDAIRRVLTDHRGQPPAAIILLTDGVTTAGVPLTEAATDARRSGVPLFSVGFGNDQGPRDIEIVDVLVDDAVFVGDLVSLQLRIHAQGLAGQQTKVKVRRETASAADAPAVDAAIQEQTIALPPSGEVVSIQFLDRPEAVGEVTYTAEAGIRDDEVNIENNRQVRKVDVRDDKIRVLLASGYPNYEFRFLKSLLERDASIDLNTFLQDADPDFAEQDKTALRSFPISREDILSYDVLVIGDLDPRLLPQTVWPAIRAMIVEQGGGAAFLAGPRSLPWRYAEIAEVRGLLPTETAALEAASVLTGENTLGEFPIQPTSVGLQSPSLQLGDTSAETESIWQQLAPQYWIAKCGPLKPAAQVLATARLHRDDGPVGESLPAICFQYVGAGRVLFHAIDSTWLWRRGVGDAYFSRYWVQAIRYLARGKLTAGRGVSLTTDRREYRYGDAVQIRARFSDPKLAPVGDFAVVSLESFGQPRRQLSLQRNRAAAGVFDGSLNDLPRGGYQALLTEPSTPENPPEARFTIVSPPGEMARLEMDRDALVAAAETTHGKLYTFADADQLLADLPPGQPVPIANLPPVEIWNRWWLLSLFLLCLVGEWVLRKRQGML
jgi:hypothetical protein